MKKLLSIVLCTAFAASLFACTTGFTSDDITVELDGSVIDFDVNPEIINGSTMVPLRKIFEEIGANVKWNNETQTVSARKGSKTVTLAVNSSELQIDRGKTDDSGNAVTETVTLDAPAQMISDRVLVPVRAISESFGFSVDWDEDNQKVIIKSDKDNDSQNENTGLINLNDMTFEGSGIEINGNRILITEGGEYTLTGALSDGCITVSANEKVKLRLNGASITSDDGPCIFVESADKAYITVSKDTKNYLAAKNSADGAVFSKDKLEIKGSGGLEIESPEGHGIKVSDNLKIEDGNIKINAASDGIHVNDTFNMTGGSIDITATGDGIDSESIVNISGGTINIETNGVPVETDADSTNTDGKRGMPGETADVEFEKSSKGINAEWMLCISGGEININAASHGIHCQDEIEISGGSFGISSKYEKGISAHGNLTVGGSETVIDIAKSTEGMESKNILTINDGIIKINSSDDAINATGGNSGNETGMRPDFKPDEANENRLPNESFNGFSKAMPDDANMPDKPQRIKGERPGSDESPFKNDKNDNFAPPERDKQSGITPDRKSENARTDMKDCLVINGGELELYAEDDCLDSNGNLIINGGTIKATKTDGTFAGPFGVIDPDGQITISEKANLIFATGRGNERNLSLNQNTVTIYCSEQHSANEKITVSDKSGNTVYEYSPGGSFGSVLISSEKLKTGEKYVITIGDEVFETEITEQNITVGTQQNTNNSFRRGGVMR